MKVPKAGGGWHAIHYTFAQAIRSGGIRKMWRALRSRNACKTCALGMGGQRGGMVNEAGHFPEVCKKSLQAQQADMQAGIRSEFFERHSIAELGRLSARELEHSGRLRQPLYAGAGASHYQPIEWEEAVARIVDKLRTTDPHESFWYFSGRSSNEAGFLTQLAARCYGTNNINNCSYYCHQASGVGLSDVVGSGTATVRLEDLDHCDLLFIIGANPASNHPRFLRTVMELKRRGGTCVVINPLKETGLVRFKIPSDTRSLLFGTRIADHYIQPKIGGDQALLAGIAKALYALPADSAGLAHDFVERHCKDHEEFRTSIDELGWDQLETESGVGRTIMERLARVYAQSEATVFAWAMGITHHANGVANVRSIANLAMLRGMVGRPGAGLLPLRGHSNVQGMGSMGVTPTLKRAFFDKLQQHYPTIQLPTEAGLDTLACMEAADQGRMRFAWCLGGNLYGSNPDSAFASQALAKIDLVVQLSTTLNLGHLHGRGRETLILPVLARDEEPAATTQESMFSLVRVSDGGPRRHIGPLSEIQVISRIADSLFEDHVLDWCSLDEPAAIRAMIAKVVPGYGDIEQVDPEKKEFFVDGRHLDQPQFPTEDGRARFFPISLPVHAVGLRLMTIRSEGQFNSVVYEEHDRYRGMERRDVIMVAAADRRRLGLEIDQIVTVRSDTGSVRAVVKETDIAVGSAAMYYPEANPLVPRSVDGASRTPAFKCVAIHIEA